MRHVLVLLLLAAPAWADTADEILTRARGNPQQALTDVEALLAKNPKDAKGHQVHAMILAALGRKADAVPEYDAAAQLDPALADDAEYNAGVILLGLGKEIEGIAHLEAALKANPKDTDAAYNLGQVHYNRKEYDAALAAWSTARALAPDDFDVAKKVLQALNALGRTADAAKARADVFALWKAAKDPAVARLKEYVFDQFESHGWHVYAFETFDPSGDLANVFTFKLAGPDDNVVGSVNVETDSYAREKGVPYMLCVSQGSKHSTLDVMWKTLPDYATLKPIVEATIGKQFGERKK